MARLKTTEESCRIKLALANRLVALRSELFGERGAPELARRLGIPSRTWYNYERGCTVPAEIILRLITLTSVEAAWLLDGRGPKFSRSRFEMGRASADSVGPLLSRAVELLAASLELLGCNELTTSSGTSQGPRLPSIGLGLMADARTSQFPGHSPASAS